MRMGLRLRRGKLRTSGAVGGTGPYSGCGLKRDHTPPRPQAWMPLAWGRSFMFDEIPFTSGMARLP